MTEAGQALLAGKRILVVEDEYWLAAEIAHALEEEGAEILGPAGTMAQAQDLLEQQRPDCAVLDINLHGEMAFSIAEHLQQAEVPFAIASGYDGLALPPSLARVPRLQKPFDPRQLRSVLPGLLAGELAQG